MQATVHRDAKSWTSLSMHVDNGQNKNSGLERSGAWHEGHMANQQWSKDKNVVFKKSKVLR